MKLDKRMTLFIMLASLVLLLNVPALTTVNAAPPIGPDMLADFEAGVPTGWFVYNGASTVSTTAMTVSGADPLARPGQTGDNGLLQASYNIVDYGGFGADLNISEGGPVDWSLTDGFSFWFHGTGNGLAYQAEISDNRSDPGSDTSERFDYVFTDDTAGWRYIAIPWTDFTRATDYQPPGAPDDGLTLTEMWAWAVVLPFGSNTVYFDNFGLINHVVDDFESGVAPGTSCSGIPLGFCTFQDSSSTVAVSTAATPPAPLLPAFGEPNAVAQLDLDVAAYAGFIHGFTNEAGDTWIPQDWSAYAGFALYIYGNNSGTDMFIDLLENRNPGSTTDDAERWTVTIPDDYSGWRYFEFPFEAFVRKNVGNGAPNDGLSLDEVHGWAFGTVGTPGSQTYYLDQASLFGQASERPLEVTLSAADFKINEGTDGAISVELTRPLKDEDPAQVSVDFVIIPGDATPGVDYVSSSSAGTLTFVKDGPEALSIPITALEDEKHENDERAVVRIFNPVDIALGFGIQSSITIVDNDPLDANLIDDFEHGAFLWDASGGVSLDTLQIPDDDPLALPGQGAFENVAEISAPKLVAAEVAGGSESICNAGDGVVPVAILTTDSFDATSVDHTTVRLGDAAETHVDKKTGEARRHAEDVDGDGDTDLVFHFRYAETGLGCDAVAAVLAGSTFDGGAIIAGDRPLAMHDFPVGQDWSLSDGLRFWYYGQGNGETVDVTLKDNRAPDPGPSGWNLVWSDEFNETAGTPPNPANWTHEIGDGTFNGNPGWGNSELQYYTDSTDNAATDGAGNLVITAQEADGSLPCYYGDCEYTSARLISWYKAEFAYGRIESRIEVPQGAGLWPAFWSLGTDIGEVGWPQSGEIDFMEFVGRIPNEIFGTIHGPGYSGGGSFGGVYDFGEAVFNDFHTFAVEWEPGLIKWYVDDILYHTATPADVAPNEWVFNHPFFIILNVAVGGNFGGPVGADTTFPQTMTVDYVRVYQGPDTAERFEASFVDDTAGWKMVEVPFTDFTRSSQQPAGAPDDGLGLNEVWGYGFSLAGGTGTGSVLLDQVKLMAPSQITVINLNDSGPGSLRQAIDAIASGGMIDFDPSLGGGTLGLTSGPLVISGKEVSIDGETAPGVVISGGGADRVLIVEAGATANVSYLTIADGFGWQLAGGILNNGALTLDHVTVTGNTMATDAGDYWQGGGGIYNGEGAMLNLIDSSVANNTAGWSGGGVYSFFNTMTNIVRSTISGNVSNDVGGGIRSLGEVTVSNSTISSNTSTGWHGGAIFHTDGDLMIANSTIADNIAPDWSPSAIFIGEYDPSIVPTFTLINTIIAGNQWYACEQYASGNPVNVVSGGYNLVQDGSCNPVASDIISAVAGLGGLADNGGSTSTHALLAGSPAIDAADDAVCPATDQRGVVRPQGAACDVGAYEFVP